MTIKDKVILIVVSCMAMLLYLLFINIKPVYLIQATVVSENVIYGKLSGRKMRAAGLPRIARKALRAQFNWSKQNSIVSFHEKLETLKSRHFTESFIKEYKLMPIILAEKSTDLKKRHSSQTKMYLAIKKLQKRLKVKVNKENQFISVELVWHNANEGAGILHNMLQYINVFIAQKQKTALIKQLAKTYELEANIKPLTNSTRRAILMLRERIEGGIPLASEEFTPALYVLDPPRAPETPLFKVPKVPLAIILIVSLLFTCATIKALRYRTLSLSSDPQSF